MKTGFIGWRGMVGSVLIQRMLEENDFVNLDPIFFTTSQAGKPSPLPKYTSSTLVDAYDISELKKMDVILSCQGGNFTEKIHPLLRDSGWNGYWIDAASTLRMEKDSTIILDPINNNVIKEALDNNQKDFIGGNCTVSLMLMAIGGLFKADLIEWVSSMTYQAASGAGANNMKELISQKGYLYNTVSNDLKNPSSAILDIDQKITHAFSNNDFPNDNFTVPLAGSLIPWIDRSVEMGQTREEWKGYAETNKILQKNEFIPIDGICVRIGAMRCHSQALTIKLKDNLPINEIETIIDNDNEWVTVISNDKIDTLNNLTPAAISGTLKIPIGRIRKMRMGEQYISAFTVGDQLLWGAAEPLRRMLNILQNNTP